MYAVRKQKSIPFHPYIEGNGLAAQDFDCESSWFAYNGEPAPFEKNKTDEEYLVHFVLKQMLFQNSDFPLTPIHADSLSVLQSYRGLMDSHHGRDAVFARDNGAVRHHAPHFGDETSRCHEKWSPGWVGTGADKDLAGEKLSSTRIVHHMNDTFHNTR